VQERERRELELLRTGRPAEAPESPREDTRQRQEIAARREAVLAELRRRMREPGGADETGDDFSGVLVQIPGTSGPIVVRRVPRAAPSPGPAPAPPTPTRSRGAPATVTPQRPQRVKRSGRPPRQSMPAPQSPVKSGVGLRLATPPEIEETHRTTTDDGGGVAAQAAAALVDARALTPKDWRRAFIMREILEPPPGLRELGDHLPG
jgi:hypothetical protein